MPVIVLLAGIALAAAPPPSASVALVERIQAHHEKVRDLKGQFTQTYTSGLLGREVVEKGTVSIKRPDRMLWKYEQPEEKVFVSDGRTSYFYVPADKQVIVREAAGQRGVALDLLSGRSDLLGEFEVSAVDGAPDRVRLVPRKNDPDTREVVVTADASGRITALEMLDLQGNRSTFRFEHVQENVELPDRLFEFKIPRGVEVVTG